MANINIEIQKDASGVTVVITSNDKGALPEEKEMIEVFSEVLNGIEDAVIATDYPGVKIVWDIPASMKNGINRLLGDGIMDS